MAELTHSSRSDQIHSFAASFMGWALDSFDFFVVVFLVGTLASVFHVSKALIILTLTATLGLGRSVLSCSACSVTATAAGFS